ncbi:hypothetical protein [Sphingomonas sp. PAMC 26621]|uniref:glycoside hydrolase family 130 protein n=1 Tax=Sphingomonas sp. PAMC 26621 TaxID=1112213 RepID=UPI0002898B39|nr:hypothetical protein [Sphingomonas sp. PAMC 26621]
MKGFIVEAIEPVTLGRQSRLVDMYVLSPFIWRTGDSYELLVRAVPRRDDEPRLKMAEIWYGTSSNGLHFEMDEAPVLFPGPGLEDLDGCEDPTVIVSEGRVHCWYTGWNQAQRTGRLMYAAGPDARSLNKQRRVLDSRPPYANPKEATVAPAADGSWRLLFEYAEDEHSKIGAAAAPDLHGPWEVIGPLLAARPDHWDNWHLSTGPVIGAGSKQPVMFYNGATHDAHWRIGWAALDAGLGQVVARCDGPLIAPEALASGATDIAFAASAIEDEDHIWLYYSLSDKDLFRARLRRL